MAMWECWFEWQEEWSKSGNVSVANVNVHFLFAIYYVPHAPTYHRTSAYAISCG